MKGGLDMDQRCGQSLSEAPEPRGDAIVKPYHSSFPQLQSFPIRGMYLSHSKAGLEQGQPDPTGGVRGGAEENYGKGWLEACQGVRSLGVCSGSC